MPIRDRARPFRGCAIRQRRGRTGEQRIALRAAVLGLVIAALCLAYSRVARATPPDAAIPRSFFGMTLIDRDHWPTVTIGALGKGTLVNWEYIEPARGTYDWSNLDGWVAAAAAHGVDFFYSNNGVPPWAVADPRVCRPSYPGSRFQNCPSALRTIADWDDYYTRLVRRYRGRIKYYELWNEPYQDHALTISELVELTRHAFNIIRANDPSAKIITPSMAGNRVAYAQQYFAAGGPVAVDVVSFHAYPNPNSRLADYPEKVANGGYLYPRSLQSLISQYFPGKPVWDTEGSWNRSNVGNFTTPEQQAAFIARWYLLHWSEGVTRNYWYAWDNRALGTMMPSIVGSNVPAAAFQELQNWLVGARMPKPCAEANDGVTWTCGLTRPGGYQAQIVWNARGETTYTPPPGYSRFRRLSGGSTRLRGATTIGIVPILLEK